MARILVVTPQLPYPPEQGTSLRNYNILRGLSDRHKVSLLSFYDSDDEPQIPNELGFCQGIDLVPAPKRSVFERIFGLVSSKQPDMAKRLYSQEMEKLVYEEIIIKKNDLSNPFDILQIEGIELAYTLAIAKKTFAEIKVVFDNHNAESDLQRKSYLADRRNPRRWHAALYSLIQVGRLEKYETEICRQADWVTVVSEQDEKKIRSLGRMFKTSVIPNCIDINEYDLIQESERVTSDLLFVGKMDYRPNVDAMLWFFKEIWPEIKRNLPDISLTIVGKNPHPRLRDLEKSPGITLTGIVRRVQPYLKGAKVVILPFRVGSGTRLKFIEAMAASKAIVSTTMGVEGFDVSDRHELLIADQPAAFGQAVMTLMANPTMRLSLGEAARKKAVKYDWRQVIPKFDRVYENLLDS